MLSIQCITHSEVNEDGAKYSGLYRNTCPMPVEFPPLMIFILWASVACSNFPLKVTGQLEHSVTICTVNMDRSWIIHGLEGWKTHQLGFTTSGGKQYTNMSVTITDHQGIVWAPFEGC